MPEPPNRDRREVRRKLAPPVVLQNIPKARQIRTGTLPKPKTHQNHQTRWPIQSRQTGSPPSPHNESEKLPRATISPREQPASPRISWRIRKPPHPAEEARS